MCSLYILRNLWRSGISWLAKREVLQERCSKRKENNWCSGEDLTSCLACMPVCLCLESPPKLTPTPCIGTKAIVREVLSLWCTRRAGLLHCSRKRRVVKAIILIKNSLHRACSLQTSNQSQNAVWSSCRGLSIHMIHHKLIVAESSTSSRLSIQYYPCLNEQLTLCGQLTSYLLHMSQKMEFQRMMFKFDSPTSACRQLFGFLRFQKAAGLSSNSCSGLMSPSLTPSMYCSTYKRLRDLHWLFSSVLTYTASVQGPRTIAVLYLCSILASRHNACCIGGETGVVIIVTCRAEWPWIWVWWTVDIRKPLPASGLPRFQSHRNHD